MLVYEPFHWYSLHKHGSPTTKFICGTSYRIGIYQNKIENELGRIKGAGGRYGD